MRSHRGGNTSWSFQHSARRGLPPGQNFVVPGQSWQNQPRQSRGGQNLLAWRDPSPTAYLHPEALAPSVVTRGVIPYYDPAAAPLFVAQFGSGDAGLSRKALLPQLVPPVLKRVAPLVGGMLLVAGGMGLATYALGSAAIGSGNEFAGKMFDLMLAFDLLSLAVFFPGAVITLGVLIEGKDGG